MKPLRIIIFFLLLIPYSLPLCAQQHKIDSLKAAIGTAKEDSDKIKTLNQLSIELIRASEDIHAKEYAYDAITIAEQSEARGNEPSVIKEGKALAYILLGNIYSDEGNYPEALKDQLLALKIEEQTGFKKGLSGAYNNVGTTYWILGNYPEALRNYSLALDISKQIQDKRNMSAMYNNMAAIYMMQSKYSEAMENNLAALKLTQEMGDKRGIATSYGNIGLLYVEFAKGEKNADSVKSKYDKALQYQLLSLKIKQEIGSKGGIASSNINLCELYIILNRIPDAKKCADEALLLSKLINDKDRIRGSYKCRVELDSIENNFADAYKDEKIYIAYRDSLYNEDNTKKLVQSQMQYDFDKKQTQEKAEQDKKDAIAQADKRKQQIITGAVGLGLLLVVIFSGLLFSRFRVTQRQKVIIEKQKALVEEKNKEVLDSITYAKRLQDAILPPLSVIKKVSA